MVKSQLSCFHLIRLHASPVHQAYECNQSCSQWIFVVSHLHQHPMMKYLNTDSLAEEHQSGGGCSGRCWQLRSQPMSWLSFSTLLYRHITDVIGIHFYSFMHADQTLRGNRKICRLNRSMDIKMTLLWVDFHLQTCIDSVATYWCVRLWLLIYVCDMIIRNLCEEWHR